MLAGGNVLQLFSATISNCSDPTSCDVNLPSVGAGSAQLGQIIQIALGIFGAIAVLVLVIAALRFVSAQGNPQETAKARSTIIYAAVGIVVIASAEAIVAFVAGRL